MPEQITLYHDVHKASPYSHKVELALLEAGASFKSHGFDVYSKPSWFVEGVNPITGKIPALTYGGPDVPPEQPSPLSTKLTESSVILEFIADVFPSSDLLPKDPVSRARVRFFADAVAKHVETPAVQFLRGLGTYEKLLEGLEVVQGLLPEEGKYAVGDTFTIADAAAAPFFARLELMVKTDVGGFEPGMGKKLGEALEAEKFARFRKYRKALLERESMKKSFDLDQMEVAWRAIFAKQS
ncbi:hypothetical protein HYDPIDRAFT_113664 [Hydnomerulius pinastri MD-312]|uniref:Glutathione transferase n=1 Tax=Hydnomerulius pinastri MD-312 TaxID=994086 RepID=A0A0C9WE72_9AGAM|nr:hypothetical protein HYDPIDRAFT_113664 [Hydnomerulius pinastri MD-312]